ncbi:hypothetical protein FQN57_005069 [Myotisia sp. PD_48]|nr:hypothetical protein FQN57_005069 [Myotisia sp. PD_48]
MAVTDEKRSTEHVEASSLKDTESTVDMYTEKQMSRIRRRVDLRLIPCLGLMYAVSLMDRKNVANAAIAGMRQDLDLIKGYRYSTITLVFFVTYVIFQAPMTVVCRKIGPPIFLPALCMTWAAVIIGFGFSKNWQTLVGLRLVLGLLEAGYFPGCLYLLSTWYTRYEVAKRYSVFYLIGSFASAMSGIIAYGLMQMEGVRGIRGWQWIFILEGVLTGAIAIFCGIFIIRFPDQERDRQSMFFLKQEEVDAVVARLNKDRGDVEAEPFDLKKFLAPATEVEVWGFAFMFFCATTVAYAFSYFLPIILKENMKFSTAASQCLVAPPYAFAGILMYGSAWLGDKYRTRGPIVIANSVIAVVGLAVMGFHEKPAVRYFGTFLCVAGVNASLPAMMAYQANNIRGQWKRAFCSASLSGFGGIGGIAGSLIFRSQDAPKYIPGMIATLVAAGLIIVNVVILTMYFNKKNAQADRGEIVINDDPTFRYTT